MGAAFKPRQIAVIKSGRDASGVNVALWTLTKLLKEKNCELVGFHDGLLGLAENHIQTITPEQLHHHRFDGGSYLRSGICRDFTIGEIRTRIAKNLKAAGCETLVAFGGEGTGQALIQLQKEQNINSVLIPTTADNDVPQTDRAIGFETSVGVGVELIDRLRESLNSSQKIFVVEVAGKNTGIGAIDIGLAVNADGVYSPDISFSAEELYRLIQRKQHCIFIVAEGRKTGRAHDLAELVRKKQAGEAKVVLISELQRLGKPSPSERLLATKYAVKAVEFLLDGKNNIVVSLQGARFLPISLIEAFRTSKKSPDGLLRLIKELSH